MEWAYYIVSEHGGRHTQAHHRTGQRKLLMHAKRTAEHQPGNVHVVRVLRDKLRIRCNQGSEPIECAAVTHPKIYMGHIHLVR